MTIRHATGSYEVVALGLQDALAALPVDGRVITDDHVFERFGGLLPSHLPVLRLPPGEATKGLEGLERCVRWLATSGASRATSVVAFGGGVVGDLAGFAAASYMRGVPLIQIPTTLLAQVDSSVGGKVGIDLPEGKNLMGAFHPPSRVYVCREPLRTLPQRQIANGMAEVLKYGFIMDAPLLDLPPKDRSLTPDDDFENLVMRCVELKAHVVEQDERETTGLRAILNFGHTVGHAIEHVTGYGPVLHGEAISIGMVAEARLGELLGVSELGVALRVADELSVQGLPTTHGVLKEKDRLLEAMTRDKKTVAGRLAFSLLTAIGECKLVRDVDENVIRSALDET